MSLSVKHYYNLTWNDISDYVVGASSVPYISRNRDWSLRADNWSFQVASTIRNFYNNGAFVFSAGDRIAVWNDAILLFIGYVKTAPLNYDSLTFDLEIVSDLQKLDDHKIDYTTLHASLIAGSPTQYQYRLHSYYIMPTVHYLYLMQKIFSIAGMTLDTSSVDNVVAFHYYYDGYDADVKYKDLFIGESELYCLNQSIDAYHTVIDNTLYDYNRDKITFFALLKEVCRVLSFMIVPVSVDNYKLILPTSNYSISDTDKYEYKSEKIQGEEKIDNLGLSIQESNGNNVLAGSAKTNMQTTSLGKGGGLEWLSKLFFGFIYEVIIYNEAKAITITNATYAVGYLTITTATPHGLNPGDPFRLYGLAGMTEVNNLVYDLVATLSTAGTTIYANFGSTPSAYIEGGWVYKDTNINYWNSFRLGSLSPTEISTNPTIPITGEINVLKNQVKAKSSDCTKETIGCPIQTAVLTTVENFIDLEKRQSQIIQET